MAILLKHQFQSAKGDGADATQVQPSNWNAEHTLTLAAQRLLGRYAATAGAVQELSLGAGFTINSTTGEITFTPPASSTTVTKAANENRSTPASAEDDATLKFAMLANTKYIFRLVAFINSVPDLLYGFNGPASPTLVRVSEVMTKAAAVEATFHLAYQPASLGDNGPAQCIMMDGIIHNGANAGDFVFRWGPAVTGAGAITLYAGSYIEYRAM